jgi:hypothetical protein
MKIYGYGYGNSFAKRNSGGGPTLPVNTVAPVVSGTAVVGQTLTTTNGTWTNSPSSFSYQWFRGATPVGTNSVNYTPLPADAGQSITCIVTATNADGSANATSNALIIMIRWGTASVSTWGTATPFNWG